MDFMRDEELAFVPPKFCDRYRSGHVNLLALASWSRHRWSGAAGTKIFGGGSRASACSAYFFERGHIP